MAAAAAYETSTIYRLGKMNATVQLNHMIFSRIIQISLMVSKEDLVNAQRSRRPAGWTRGTEYILQSQLGQV